MTFNELPASAKEKLMRGPYGRALVDIIRPLVVPFYCGPRAAAAPPRNGSAFFVRTNAAVFGATAWHVYEEFIQQIEQDRCVVCQLHNLKLAGDLQSRLISHGRQCDLATFRISAEELNSLGNRTVPWPPQIPPVRKSVLIGGFPGVGKRLSESREILTFGLVKTLTPVDSVSDRDISMVRPPDNEVTDVEGKGLPPRNFDFGGMSGGPVIAVLDCSGITSWALAGVIYECGVEFEIIKAVRADLITEDGTILL